MATETKLSKAHLTVFMAILTAIVGPMYWAWQRDVTQLGEQIASGYEQQITDCRADRDAWRTSALKEEQTSE